MAEIVAVLALSHAPGLTGWIDKAGESERRNLLDGYAEMGRWLRARRPDAIVGIANDHILNLPLDNTPDFCVGTAAEWHGPAPWFRDWLNVPDYTVKGDAALAKTIVREGARRGVRFAFRDELLFDDNWSVPLHFLTPDHDVPLVPIHMNCVVPPLPDPDRCYRVGETIAAILRDSLPAGRRIAVMATGGLSHDPGGPRYFQVDDAFDRWVLGLMEAGDAPAVLREATAERMMAAGDGGTTELLAWIVALGAAGGRPARTVCYEPSVALRCGMGGVVWDRAPAAPAAAS